MCKNSNLKVLGGFCLFFIILLYSCKKEEGFGGKATVKGKIIEKIYDENFSALHRTRPSADEDVFLVFGDNDYFDDDAKTSASGDFEFKYLLPGDYKIYFYSLDSANYYPDNKIAIVKEFTISKSDDVIDLGELIKLDVVDYDEGNAIVKGNLTELVYDNDFSVLQKSHPAADEDIFLSLAGTGDIIDNVSTSAEGNFEFRYLLPGSYKIYYYSVDSANYIPGNKAAVVKEFSVTENDKIIDIGSLKKFKTVDYNEGSGTIQGVFMTRYYINNFTFIREISPSQNEDVFLVFNNHSYIEDRVRTMYNGAYAFTNLIKGAYKVYGLSDNPNGTSQKLQVYKEVNITEDNQIVTIDTLYLNND